MDIKLKSIKYSQGMKAAAFIVIWICILGMFGSGVFLLYNQNILTTESYFDTNEFSSEYSKLAHNVTEFYVKLGSEEEIKASGEEKDVILDNVNRFHRIEERLSNTVNFVYYVKNSETGEIKTNTTKDSIELLQKQRTFMYLDRWNIAYKYSLYSSDIQKILKDTPYEIYVAVTEPLQPGDIFYDEFTAYSKNKLISTYAIILLIASFVIVILAFLYLASVTGRKKQGGEIILTAADRIYTDVYTIGVLILAILSASLALGIHNTIIETIIFSAIILTIDVFVGLPYILSMIRQVKTRQLIKNTLTMLIYGRLKSFARLSFNGEIFKVWILLLLLLYGGVNIILYAAVRASWFNFPVYLIPLSLLLSFNIVALYFTAKSLRFLSVIMHSVNEISEGNLEIELKEESIPTAFSGFAYNIQRIQDGLRKAVDKAVKGERMKTDLITNVSHDLKTPLTSIINYVDLLKKENIENEKANGYIDILEDKSSRLKLLIEDLVEASKASSGNLSVNFEKVDLYELIMQECGELEEKIKNTGLDVRIETTDANIFICADGKHMWRIVENLMSNVISYSLPQSRVYIDLTRNQELGVLIIKNISACPLNIEPELLTERFVRGDVSRTTEGSGLGLSIAENLVSMQKGIFDIKIDGDLFKVTIEMPLWVDK